MGQPVYSSGQLDEKQADQIIASPEAQSTSSADVPGRNRFDLLDSILDLTLICGFMLSWVCFAHSIRRMLRPFLQFYAPKLAIVVTIWLLATAAFFLADNDQLEWHSPKLLSNQVSTELEYYQLSSCHF